MSRCLRIAYLASLGLAFLMAGGGLAIAKDHGKPRSASDVSGIIVHAIGGPACKNGKVFFAEVGHDAAWWTAWFARQDVIGIHYVIGRAGDVSAGIPELEVANHALGNNPSTIGIELVNKGDGIEPFPQPQVEALVALVKDIRARYGIDAAHVKGHSEVDHGKALPCGSPRKVDPGPALDLEDVIRRSNP